MSLLASLIQKARAFSKIQRVSQATQKQPQGKHAEADSAYFSCLRTPLLSDSCLGSVCSSSPLAGMRSSAPPSGSPALKYLTPALALSLRHPKPLTGLTAVALLNDRQRFFKTASSHSTAPLPPPMRPPRAAAPLLPLMLGIPLSVKPSRSSSRDQALSGYLQRSILVLTRLRRHSL